MPDAVNDAASSTNHAFRQGSLQSLDSRVIDRRALQIQFAEVQHFLQVLDGPTRHSSPTQVQYFQSLQILEVSQSTIGNLRIAEDQNSQPLGFPKRCKPASIDAC